MSQNIEIRHGISRTLIIFLGVFLGIASSYAWFLGYIEFVRETLPYLFAYSLLLLLMTAILKARCGNAPVFTSDESHPVNPTYVSVSKYSTIVLIAAAILLIVTMTIMATHLSVILRFILGLIAGTSLWISFLAFISMIYCIYLKRKC